MTKTIVEFRKRRTWSMLVVAVALTLGTQSAISSSQSTELKVGKRGEISLSEPTQVGEVLLQAGYYQVRHQDGPGGSHAMVFIRMVPDDSLAYSPLRATNDEVRVQCHVHPLYLKNKHTMVHIGNRNGGQVIKKIMIRGENVEHRFDQ